MDIAGALTPRQRQIYRLKALGFTELQVARHLGISISTVKTHTRRARTTTGRTTVEIVVAVVPKKD